MSEPDEDKKFIEIDRLLNDPNVALEPNRIWSLLAEISGRRKEKLRPA